MHDAGAGLQRAEEIDGMIRRVAEEQRDRLVLAVAGAQERRRRDLGQRFQFGIADRTVAEFDRRPRAEYSSAAFDNRSGSVPRSIGSSQWTPSG